MGVPVFSVVLCPWPHLVGSLGRSDCWKDCSRAMPVNLFGKFMGFAMVLGVLIGFLRLTAIRWWQVPLDDPELTTSLAPSLWPGDWVLQWRLTAPGVGALVNCPDPEDPSERVVGRIATLGGARVRLREHGKLDVSGQKIKVEQTCRKSSFFVEDPNNGSEITLHCDIEIIGGIHHDRGTKRDARIPVPDVDDEVEPDQLYLVSDNRQFPFDSRDFGPLEPSACRERIFFRLVSERGFGDVESRLSWID